MADKDRQRKVEKHTQKIAGNFFSANNPPGQIVTVTKVEASPDLTHLTFFVNILPEQNNDEDLDQLQQKLPQLRKQIGDKMRFRKVPKLSITFDERESSRRRVEKILNQAE